MLRRAREQSRLSQTELALLAGIAQSVVSTYENGRREPSLATLRRLIEATGQKLTIDVVPTRPLGLPHTPRGELLRRRRSAIHDIAARYGARNLRVFGSVARGDDGPGSDIDIVADLPESMSLFELAGLRNDLSDLLEAPVDVVPTRSLRAGVAADVARDAVAL